MKRIVLIMLSIFTCAIATAATETINWYVDGNTYATTTCQTGGDIVLPQTPTKYGYTFNGWIGYTPIEYIESTGTQYIDTGVAPNQDTGIKTKIKISSTDNSVFFGKNRDGGGAFESFIWDNGSALYFTYAQSNQIIRGLGLKIDDTLEYDWNKNIINYSKNDVEQALVSFSAQPFSNTRTFLLFAEHNNNDAVTHMASIKMYYFQIYDNNVLVCDMIPVLDDNGVACMFDKVEKKFYYNQGTGQFIAGPIINQ